MKKIRLFLTLGLLFALFFIVTQVFASPLNSPQDKNTPKPKNTPGAVATQKAEEKVDKVKGKHENLKGVIETVNETTVTITLRDGSTATINLNADTRLKVPGMKGATLEILQSGMQIMVQAIRDQSDNLIARSLMVKPNKPTKVHHVGWVTAYSPGASITIQAHDGTTTTYTLTDQTKILPTERADKLGVGSRVTIIAPRNPATPQGTALGIVVHPADSGTGSQPSTP